MKTITPKQKFKKEYSNLRRRVAEFNASMQNMCCGDDDAASERFNHHITEFLKGNEALAYAFYNSCEDCYLFWREERLSHYTKISVKLEILKDDMEHRTRKVA